MALTVDDIIENILRTEGGYADDPADRGGKTMYGITEAVARANGYDGPMRELPRALAIAIYRRRYVDDPGFSLIVGDHAAIGAELVDTGVNMGPATATRFLQRALNALNRQGRDYADIAVDGQCGPATRRALDAFLSKRGRNEGGRVLLRALEALQGERYIALAERRQPNEAFVYGWLANRIGL